MPFEFEKELEISNGKNEQEIEGVENEDVLITDERLAWQDEREE